MLTSQGLCLRRVLCPKILNERMYLVVSSNCSPRPSFLFSPEFCRHFQGHETTGMCLGMELSAVPPRATFTGAGEPSGKALGANELTARTRCDAEAHLQEGAVLSSQRGLRRVNRSPHSEHTAARRSLSGFQNTEHTEPPKSHPAASSGGGERLTPDLSSSTCKPMCPSESLSSVRRVEVTWLRVTTFFRNRGPGARRPTGQCSACRTMLICEETEAQRDDTIAPAPQLQARLSKLTQDLLVED